MVNEHWFTLSHTEQARILMQEQAALNPSAADQALARKLASLQHQDHATYVPMYKGPERRKQAA